MFSLLEVLIEIAHLLSILSSTLNPGPSCMESMNHHVWIYMTLWPWWCHRTQKCVNTLCSCITKHGAVRRHCNSSPILSYCITSNPALYCVLRYDTSNYYKLSPRAFGQWYSMCVCLVCSDDVRELVVLQKIIDCRGAKAGCTVKKKVNRVESTEAQNKILRQEAKR